MVLAQHRIRPGKKNFWDFEMQTDYIITARRPDLVIVTKKKTTCRSVDFVVLADHTVKLKESEER